MVLEVIIRRQSVRSYQEKEIQEAVLNQVLEAGRLAPSANNKQDWKFIIVRDKNLKEKIVSACKNQKFVGEASVVIVGCATNPSNKMGCGEYSYPVDLAIALDHMSLQATSLGLGSCWIGNFYENQVKEILGIPKDFRIVGLMPIGYIKELGEKRARKHLSEIICNDKYTS